MFLLINRQFISRRSVMAAMALGFFLYSDSAFSISKEQAIQTCRELVGRPNVTACMKTGGTEQACKDKNAPIFSACMAKQMEAPIRGNVALPVPAEPAKLGMRELGKGAPVAAPPRTIADITAVIDRERPDKKMIAALQSKADAKPTGKEARSSLAQFYLDRGTARSQLGRLQDAVADGEQAIKAGRGAVNIDMFSRILQFTAIQHYNAGEVKKGLETAELMRSAITDDVRTYHLGLNRSLATYYAQIGEVAKAEAELRKSIPVINYVRTTGNERWRRVYGLMGQMFESEVDFGAAILREARGQFKEAETLYRQAELRKRAGIEPMIKHSPFPPDRFQQYAMADELVLAQARMKAKQGRLVEAEIDARRALLSRLQNGGKYNILTPKFVVGLADVLVEQGRYGEAERLIRACLEINNSIGASEQSLTSVQYLRYLASVLVLQRRFFEASDVYVVLDRATSGWPAQNKRALDTDSNRIVAFYASGQLERGVEAAENALRRNVSAFGEAHFETVLSRGLLAMGYLKTGRKTDASREFGVVIPVLTYASRTVAFDDDAAAVAARSQRIQQIVESYLALRASEASNNDDVGAQTFALADLIRSRSVQNALASSSARAAAKDPALAELVRMEQDLAKQVNAQLGMLANVLALPTGERDDRNVQSITALISKLRQDRSKLTQEISRQFPAYDEFISPRSPTANQIREVLQVDEALLSFYFGSDASFVWAISKQGPIAFAAIAASGGEIDTRISKLRVALNPQAAMISDIPPFNVAAAHELFSLLLKPVEDGWKSAKSLIVVTNGALGLLPLSVLPTEPHVVEDGETLFSGYRAVPWLARTHSITTVPSAASLRTLRGIPPSKQLRDVFVGFGDPSFTRTAASVPGIASALSSVSENVTRSLPLRRRNAAQFDRFDSAELSQLPQLPDTADELRSIAEALRTDPSKALNIGKDANEHKVKTTNLSRYKIIAFATHGLVPGELNGLTQPALALSPPEVSGTPGDGLLTMEEILGLKLDADWVILSACNTAAAQGAGAEAASGLGRAFFYAGTRALLVTNWSVHSQSAKELVSDIFQRQANDPTITRGEALRRAMMALVDGSGFLDGDAGFTYAHPLFWAPYSILGDGGRGS